MSLSSLMPACRGAAWLAIRLLLPVLATAMAVVLPAQAAMREECRNFGTEPFCAGRCPAGWYEKGLASHECWSGRKVRCCHRVCVPDQPAPGYNPNARRRIGVRVLCQRCVRWGQTCQTSGPIAGPCIQFTWERCSGSGGVPGLH